MKKNEIPEKRLWKRILTAVVLAGWLPSAFPAVHAFEEIQTDDHGGIIDNDPVTAPPEMSNLESPEYTDVEQINPFGENESSIKISQNGQQLDVQAESGQPWDEDMVIGGEEPTLEAFSVNDYMTKLGGDRFYTVPEDENLYTMSVATGMEPGDTVEYFAIRYTDEHNNKQTKYIFPKTYSLKASNDYIDGLMAEYAGGEEPLKRKHSILSGMGYSINSAKQNETALQAWSAEEFLFKTEADIQKIDEINVFMSNGSWTVQGLSISEVTSINGYGEYGFYSGKYYLSLGKKYLCVLESKTGGHVQLHANNDTLHTLGGGDSIYYRLVVPSGVQASSDPADDYYSFRIDIADQLDAGLESMLHISPQELDSSSFIEDLAIEIEYLDKNGWTRNVSMPVLLSMIGQYRMLGDSVRSVGLAQRGDTLAFTASLPEFDELLSLKLHVGLPARQSIQANGGIAGGNAAVDTTIDSDFISIAGISMYKGTCRMSNYEDGTDPDTGEQMPCYSYGFRFSSPAPELYYTNSIPSGFRVNAGTTAEFEMTKYSADSNAPLIVTPEMGNFLIRIRTDQVSANVQNCNMTVNLTYQDYSGNEKVSPVYIAKNEVLNYSGYWPTTEDPRGNFGYYYGTSAGRYIEFPVTLEDAAAITNVAIATDTISDEIQIDGISVSVADYIGKRRIYGQILTVSGGTSNYRIVRTLRHTVIPPFPITLKLLFTAGSSFNITTGTGTVIPTGEPDYSTMRYTMSYDDTKRDFGFIRSKLAYDVTVKVANDATKSNVNGDSGSRNQFYFQLQFKNGNSAFVLANQQLTSDGFRSGMDELFTIKINRDYGDVTAIRVIPEDISSDSDVFDKLNIEQITVTERTNGGAGMQYVFNNVGWIGIDYHDQAEENSHKKKPGRLLAELASTYTVSYQQKVIYLSCEISAWPWDVSYVPFEASIAADLTYLDLNDQPQTVSFDVVSRMYSYMNRTPKSYEAASDGSNQGLYNSMGTVTDPDYMLRPNHTDRFILPPLADAKTIKSMTLYIVNRSKGTMYWVISGVTLSRIFSDSGTVILKNQPGDHESDYLRSMETSELCAMVPDDSSMENSGIKIPLPSGERVKREIKFSDSSITWSENSAWTSAVTRMPESTNDTLNLYLYPTDYNKNVNESPASAVFQYTLPFSKVMQVKQGTLSVAASGTADAMYYCKGVPASNMQTLTALGISCRNSQMIFNRAVVEQVRDNVIVNRYEIVFGGSSATLGLRASPSKTVAFEDKKRQTLMMSFSENTKEMTLFGPDEDNQNVNDIAVAFQYRSSLDKNLPPELRQSYYTPYVYLSDAGIQKLMPGMMAEVPFNIPYVSEILGYRIVSFGNISAEVNGSMLVNYSSAGTSTGETGTDTPTADILEHCYCVSKRFAVTNAISEHLVQHDPAAEQLPNNKGMSGTTALAPLELTIKTAAAAAGGESVPDVPVAMNIFYKTSRGEEVYMPVADIRAYIQPKIRKNAETGENVLIDNFVAGESTSIELFLPDCEELTAFEICLADETGTAVWSVESIEYKLKLENTPYRRSVNMVFNSTPQVFSVRNVKLTSDVFVNDNFLSSVTASPFGVRAEVGQQVKVMPRVELGENGFGYHVSWIVNNTATDVTNVMTQPIEGGFVFTPQNNGSTTTDSYQIEVFALDNPDKKNIINVVVPVTKAVTVPQQTETTPPVTTPPDAQPVETPQEMPVPLEIPA